MPTSWPIRRTRLLLFVFLAAAWLVGDAVLVWSTTSPPREPVVVTHWANVYMMDEALFPNFAQRFNTAGYRTGSGRPVEIRPFLVNSGVIVDELVSRIRTGHPSGICRLDIDGGCPRDMPNPTIVTPAADHWLGQLNHAAGATVLDLEHAQGLAASFTGVIMLRDMARCLGWPNREIALADILALRQDPRGWSVCPTAKAEWGKVPLISFTDPTSSSTARSVLFELYAMATGKPVEALTLEDLTRPGVTEYVKQFQGGVDHYLPDTVSLASKIYSGPRYGHFFFNLENELARLYQGKTPVKIGAETRPRPLEWDMVLVYPKEGSSVQRHSAAVLQASWVDAEQAEAAQRWVGFLLEESQQRAFLEEGLRPATNLAVGCPLCSRFGIDPRGPSSVFDPSRIDPRVAEAIARSWGDVKKQGVLTFLVDSSASMAGPRIAEAREGVRRVLDRIDQRTLVGIVTYSSGVHSRIEPSPIAERRYDVVEAVGKDTGRGSAMYEAIRAAVEMTDAAQAEADAIRGVVLLAGGRASIGAPLHDVVQLVSPAGRAITSCAGFDKEADCLDDRGEPVPLRLIHPTGWVFPTRHSVHVFYVGIGDGADLEVGRLLAEATPGSSFEGTSERDLANVIGRFSTHF